MVILETLKNALIGISPFYNLGIMIFTAFLLVFFAASRSKGLKVFSLVILSAGIFISLVFDLIALGEGQNASNLLFNIGSMEYIQIAVLLVIMLIVVIFFSLYNFETKVFGRTLLFFNGVIIGLSFLVVSRDFIAIFSSLTLTVLFLFFIVSVNNRGDQEVSYRVLRFFIRPGISLGLVFLGFSFIYGATDFKNFQQIIESDKSGSPFVLIGIVLFITAIFIYIFSPPLQNPYSKLMGKSKLGTELVVLFPYFITGIIFLQKISGFYISFLQQSSILSYVSMAIAFSMMLLGNIIALSSRSIRRIIGFMCYSFIGLFITVLILKAQGLFADIELTLLNSYLFAFIFVSFLPVQSVTMELQNRFGDGSAGLVKGLFFKNKYIGAALAVLLLNLSGFIAFSGFVLRYNLIKSTLDILPRGLPGILVLVFLGIWTALVFANSLKLLVTVFIKGTGTVKGDKISFYKLLYIFVTIIVIAILFIGIIGLLGIFGQGTSFFPDKVLNLLIG